jgi:hypothetical protein
MKDRRIETKRKEKERRNREKWKKMEKKLKKRKVIKYCTKTEKLIKIK